MLLVDHIRDVPDRLCVIPPFLLGEPAAERVHAVVTTRHGPYDVDDDDVLLISWSNGTTSMVEAGWWHSFAGGLEAELGVFGTRGYARIWPFAEAPEGYEHCSQPMYSAQMDEFLRALAEDRQPRASGEDGRAVVAIVEEAYRSAEGI